MLATTKNYQKLFDYRLFGRLPFYDPFGM